MGVYNQKNEEKLCELRKIFKNGRGVFRRQSDILRNIIYCDHLSLHVEKTSKVDYNAYIEECQSMGYTVENEKIGDNYTAFDEDGYGLDLSYIGKTMYIALDAPIEMGTLN